MRLRNFSIHVPGSLDFNRTLRRLKLWGSELVNQVQPNRLIRATRIDDADITYEVSHQESDSQLAVRVLTRGAEEKFPAIEREVRAMLGLDLPIQSFYKWSANVPQISSLIDPLRGLRLSLAADPFEMLVSAICCQQLSLNVAFRMRDNLVKLLGCRAPSPTRELYLFPSPQAILASSPTLMRESGLSDRKISYIWSLAKAFSDDFINLVYLAQLSSEEAIRYLTKLPGVGRWTAEWFLVRCLARTDVCAADDLVVRKAVGKFFGCSEVPPAEEVRHWASQWGQFQILVVCYLLTANREGLLAK